MEEMKKTLINAIQSIDETTELFYQQKMEQGYKQFESTIVVLTQVMNQVFTYQSEGHEIGIDESQLVNALTEAMKAMEIKDTILFSDILQYELKELLEKIMTSL